MATRFDTNDFRSSASTAYWIERPADRSAPVGGLTVYLLSGAMLICALQARLRLLMLGIGRARVEELMRAHVPSGATRYSYDELIRQPFVDGNWAGRTQTALLLAAVQLGAPQDYINELASNLRDMQVGWRSLKFGILVAYKFSSSLMSAPVAGRAGDIAKLGEGIELRYSGIPGVGGPTNIVHPPQWRRPTSVTSELPRASTVNDVLGGGIRFVPGAAPPASSQPAAPPVSLPPAQPPVPPPPPASIPGTETAERIPPAPEPSRPPVAQPPPVSPPPARPAPAAPQAPVPARPPAVAVPARPTVTQGSSMGAGVAALALVTLGVGAAWMASEKKGPKRLF